MKFYSQFILFPVLSYQLSLSPFGLNLWDIFVPFCLLFLHHQCNKEQTFFGCLKIEDEQSHFGVLFKSNTEVC